MPASFSRLRGSYLPRVGDQLVERDLRRRADAPVFSSGCVVDDLGAEEFDGAEVLLDLRRECATG